MTTQRKSMSWIVSVALHGVLILIAGRYTYKMAFPEGTVETVTVETFGTQNPVAPPPSEKAPEPEVKTPKTPAKVMEAPVKPKVTKNSPPVFLPDKPSQDIHAEDKVETQDESPVVVPKAEEENVRTAKPAEETPAAEEAPAPVAEASAAPAETPTETPTTEAAAPQTAPAAGGEEHPQFGTPGTSLDVTKLSERPGNRPPTYPWMSRLRRQEGVVQIKAFVRKDGTLDSVSLYKSSGFPLLDKEAVDAFSRYRYVPGATGWILKPVTFVLKESK